MSRMKQRQQGSRALRETDAVGEDAGQDFLADFSADWCQNILNDPSYQQSIPQTRRIRPPGGESSFMNLMRETLNTATTLRAMRFFYKPASATARAELLALVSLGGGMCSHADTLHGGINTLLIDEIGGAMAITERHEPMMAVNFNVNLRRAVRTPGVILGRAWIEKPPQGRKYWVKVQLEQDGKVCIESENMYLTIKSRDKL